MKNLGNRKYCIDCSPYKKHNTKKLIPKDNITYKCSSCGETDPDKFYGRKRTLCKKCHNKEVVQRGKLLKRKAIEYKGGKCIHCGYSKYEESLDFHHLDSETKEYAISSNRNKSWNNIKKELDKCVLLCSNCHKAYHAGHFELSLTNSQE